MSNPANLERFRDFEGAKKRLLYTLWQLGMPLINGFVDPEHGLLFDFIEDQRSNPQRYPESFVSTGFQGGIITINVMEADDVARELARIELNETYRTLLGHLRHESGHYFQGLCDFSAQDRQTFNELFGDPEQDYGQALADYYANGPDPEWRSQYISAYASAHPKEDWAETWAHYLYIYDVLETAFESRLVDSHPAGMSMNERVSAWGRLSVAFNELNRSSGLNDAYPFVVNDSVRKKLSFIDQAVEGLKRRNLAPAAQ